MAQVSVCGNVYKEHLFRPGSGINGGFIRIPIKEVIFDGVGGQENVYWTIVAFGEPARIANLYVRPGYIVSATGRLETAVVTTKKGREILVRECHCPSGCLSYFSTKESGKRYTGGMAGYGRPDLKTEAVFFEDDFPLHEENR